MRARRLPALYHNTEIGQEIPHQLYTAAAQVWLMFPTETL